jgi:HEAT repeat protein
VIAHAAMWRLSEAPPDGAVRFLAARVKPVKGPDPAAVGRWVDDLDSDNFQTREAAQGRLAALGPLVGADLLRAVNGHESPEVRQRAGELLSRVPTPIPSGEPLRAVRAIAVLERFGTAEARRALTELAGGAAGAWETEEAKAALDRLGAGAAKSR